MVVTRDRKGVMGRSIRRAPLRMVLAVLVVLTFPLVVIVTPPAAANEPAAPWVGVDDSGTEVVELYFVFSSTCPHCRAAVPWVSDLAEDNDWVRVWWLQADSGDDRVAEIATSVAAETGEDIRAVPTFMYCGQMRTGWDGEGAMGGTIMADLEACRASLADPTATTTTNSPEEVVAVPVVGDVAAASVPLPIFTVIVAGLDAFNPCAFFVLLFLLSLLVHARSRTRMAAVGMTFVAVSGTLYFVFMAAWLNLFLVTDNLRWVTMGAGIIAVVLGALSAKDYFRPGIGPSASIPDSAKPGLFARMRSLIAIDRLAPVVVATIALAIVANSYELLCTAGLPMVFTRVLTLNELSTTSYYGYLALYNVIYVIPLAAIVMAFVWTLGSRKLQPYEGRTLKLLSGSMMLGLGLLLLLAPDLLERVGAAIAVVVVAVAFTAATVLVGRRRRTAPPSASWDT